MSEAQLERSVLESKEREELFAIAEALGTRPTSRAKKSDLVTAILRATGVDDDGGGPAEPASPAAPARRPRARRSAAPADAAAEAGPADDASPAGLAGGGEGVAGGVLEGGAEGSIPLELDVAVVEHAPAAPAAADVPPDQRAPSDQPAPSDQSDRDGRNGHRDPAPPGANNPGANHGGAGPNGSDAGPEGDGGGRRNRRRRGRDRAERTERELQPGAAEVPYSGEPIPVAGLLDLRDEGYGFLRTSGYLPGADDVYVSISQVRRFALRRGDRIEGTARPAGNNEKYPALLRVDTVSGLSPDEARSRPHFEDLTPLFPDSRLTLERRGDPSGLTGRIIDLVAPIGKGQRGLVVSPPKAGKTTILKQIAAAIESSNPDVHLMVLLVDERPEEVTDMRRSVTGGEVIASTFDRPSEEHTQVAELCLERAKRMVEQGRDVVIVLDGITRLARAYNLAAPATGRIMSGGIDTGALYPPKKFFGAARNIEEGGSLTILATALVETGSKMDEVIFEEFKGTGNMELRLDRRLAERRVYPAIDVLGSSTRHEELLFDRTELQQVWKLRRALGALASSEGSGTAALERLLDKMRSTTTNSEFLAEMAANPAPSV